MVDRMTTGAAFLGFRLRVALARRWERMER